MIPPPIPVPRVTITASVAPAAAPKAHSPMVAHVASLSTSVVSPPRRAPSRSRTAVPLPPWRFGAKRSTAGAVDQTGDTHPDGGDRRGGAELGDQALGHRRQRLDQLLGPRRVGSAVVMAGGRHQHLGEHLVPGAHGQPQHLRASDVDPERHASGHGDLRRTGMRRRGAPGLTW